MNAAFQNLIDEIDRKREELRCSRSGAFFRGHSRDSFQLVPSLLRTPVAEETEHNLYHEFYARAHDLVPRTATSWERLAFFQHHGIPTRLLDWTESLGVAFFFALQPPLDHPHIWIVNAFRLNRDNGITTEPRIMMAGLDTIDDYHDCFIKADNPRPWPHRKPMFLQIPWTTDRLRSQSGFFTFHPNAEQLDRVCPKYLRKIEISDDAIGGIRKFLAAAGITEHTVFPDFVGLAGFLRSRYQL